MIVKYSVKLLKNLPCWNESFMHGAIVQLRQKEDVHQNAGEIGCQNSLAQKRILGAFQFIYVKIKHYIKRKEKVHLYKYTKDSVKIPRKIPFSCYIPAAVN